jgi:uncharacterized membrane protein YjgN (DUF898 family)
VDTPSLPDAVLQPPPPPAPPAAEPLQFTGDGAEYFRIWIVNLALTIVTVGIYSAWAKVRRLQYFHRNTLLAGSGFDYHGRPLAILKGRIIAMVMVSGTKFLFDYDPDYGVVALIAVIVVLPWLLVRSIAFRLRNTSWRGVRFDFHGAGFQGYRVFFVWPLLALMSFGLLWPSAHSRLVSFQRNHATFGGSRFSFRGTIGDFYKVYMLTSLLFSVIPVALFAVVLQTFQTGASYSTQAIFFFIGAVCFYGAMLSGGPFLVSRLQNLIWNRTKLEAHEFRSDVKFGKLLWITLSNLAMTIITLGLFRPFAAIRTARYRVACVTLIPSESLEGFVGRRIEEVAAVGEEVGEFLDIDIAL